MFPPWRKALGVPQGTRSGMLISDHLSVSSKINFPPTKVNAVAVCFTYVLRKRTSLFGWNFCTLRELSVLLFPISLSLCLGRTLPIVVVMAAEVRMVLYEDDSVQVQYADGSRLQLSPCGSEFLFEKAPPVSAHPLEQPERIRQRTHFVISTYRVSKDTNVARSVLLRWAEYVSN